MTKKDLANIVKYETERNPDFKREYLSLIAKKYTPVMSIYLASLATEYVNKLHTDKSKKYFIAPDKYNCPLYCKDVTTMLKKKYKENFIDLEWYYDNYSSLYFTIKFKQNDATYGIAIFLQDYIKQIDDSWKTIVYLPSNTLEKDYKIYKLDLHYTGKHKLIYK